MLEPRPPIYPVTYKTFCNVGVGTFKETPEGEIFNDHCIPLNNMNKKGQDQLMSAVGNANLTLYSLLVHVIGYVIPQTHIRERLRKLERQPKTTRMPSYPKPQGVDHSEGLVTVWLEKVVASKITEDKSLVFLYEVSRNHMPHHSGNLHGVVPWRDFAKSYTYGLKAPASLQMILESNPTIYIYIYYPLHFDYSSPLQKKAKAFM